jgi:PIN domain nuclease of toxin-antitoxin system
VKLLLDTHIWLWSSLEPQRLVRRVDKALRDPANELWLSPVSVGELNVLLRKGVLKLPHDRASWVAKTMEDLQINEAVLTVEVALAISSINFPHGDPADQFLAATAKVLDLMLVTGDEHLNTPVGNSRYGESLNSTPAQSPLSSPSHP